MISICMAYYNRRAQLLNTLYSIPYFKEVEVVIVDDGSNQENRIEDFPSLFKHLNINLVRIEPEEKTWVNPCIAYNKAIKLAKGDKIIIQNPECYHKGNILEVVEQKLKPYNYLSFACISLPENYDVSNIDITGVTNVAQGNGTAGWYNHSQYFPRPYHFCCAITKENIINLNGFDERFANGPCYDDDELVNRIQSMGLTIKIVDSPYVAHQWHDSSHIFMSNSASLAEMNRQLYMKILSGELPKWK